MECTFYTAKITKKRTFRDSLPASTIFYIYENDERGFSPVNNEELVFVFPAEKFNANLFKITYAQVKTPQKTWYLFINNVSIGNGQRVRFDYEIDYFQSFFDWNAKFYGLLRQTTVDPLTNGNITFGMRYELPVSPIGGDTVNFVKCFENSGNAQRFYTILRFNLASGYIIVATKGDDAYEFAAPANIAISRVNWSAATELYDKTSSGGWQKVASQITSIYAYVIPENFIKDIPDESIFIRYKQLRYKVDSAEFKGSAITLQSNNFVDEIAITNNKISDFIDLTAPKIIKVGTFSTQINLTIFEQKNLNAKIFPRLSTNGDISVMFWINNDYNDITQDFAFSVVYSPAAQYFEQKITQDIIGIAGKSLSTIATAGTSAALGNFDTAATATVGGGLQIASAIIDVDKSKKQAISTKNNFNAQQNILIFGGFGFSVYTPENLNEIKYYLQKFGYLYNEKIGKNLDALTGLIPVPPCYIRIDDFQLFEPIPQRAQEQIVEMFRNGIEFITSDEL